MSREKFKKIWSVVTLVMIAVVALMLIVSCVRIYQSGDRPFDRQAMAAAAADVAVPGLLCLATVIVGLFLENEEKDKAIRSEKDLLARYGIQPEGEKERTLRKRIRMVCGIFIAAQCVYPVIYFCDMSHFSIAELSEDILRAVLTVMEPTVIALAAVYICGRMESASISREIEAYKAAGIKPGKAPEKKKADPKKRNVIRAVLCIVAVVFILLGIGNGGAIDVLGKAIRICTECIGLG